MQEATQAGLGPAGNLSTDLENGRLLSAGDLAGYLSISKTHAHKMMTDGTLPSFTIGRNRRVRKSAVDELIRCRIAAEG